MRGEVVNLSAKAAAIEGVWSPRIVDQINDLHVKVVRAHGEFVWHEHPETDELFIVLEGRLRIELADRAAAEIGPAELFVVPRGVRHRPVAQAECRVLLLEPAGTVNTGDAGGALTAADHWL